MSGALDFGFSVIQIVVGIGLLIFVHELGHFLAARWCGVRVERFFLGFDPWGLRLLQFRRRGTVYGIGLIPLGGYVKMAGENPFSGELPAPDDLFAQPPRKRLLIFVSGALMNLLIAFPIFVLCFWIGKYEADTVVGRPGTAEAIAGIRAGDRILAVNGEEVASMEEYRFAVSNRATGSTVEVLIERDGERRSVPVTVRPSAFHDTRPPDHEVAAVEEGSPAARAGLRPGDRIIAVNGTRLWADLSGIQTLLQEIPRPSPSAPWHLEVERDGEVVTLFMDLPESAARRIPHDEHLIEPVVGSVVASSPSHPRFDPTLDQSERLLPGDRILAVDGTPVDCWAHLRLALRDKGGREVALKIEREGKETTLRAWTACDALGRGMLGITPAQTSVLADVPEGTVFHEAGLRSGMRLVEVAGAGGEPPVDVLWSTPLEGRDSIQVRVAGRAEPFEIPARELRGVSWSEAGIHWAPRREFRARSLAQACARGIREPIVVGAISLRVLGRLFTREESARNLTGPVGIAVFAYESARVGFGNFLWLLGLITVSLGILNLLPVPLLDGGHSALVLYEMIARRRPGPAFEIAYQWVGLLLLLALIVFVTVNDIARLG